MLQFILRPGAQFHSVAVRASGHYLLTIRVLPADPAAALARDNATPQQIAAIRHQYGFDRPIAEQLVLYLSQVVQFSFGESQYSHRPVGVDIRQRLLATLELTIPALLIATLLGVPLGVVAGVYHNRWPDFVLRLLSITGVAVTAFWSQRSAYPELGGPV